MQVHEHFVYGFLCSVIIISIILATQYGDNFNFLKNEGLTILPSYGEALNWKSAIVFSVIFSLFFKNLIGPTSIRVVNAVMLFAFSWAIFDILWILKAVYMGSFLFGSQTLGFPAQRDVLIGITRNVIIALLFVPFCFKHFKLSFAVLGATIIFIVYWVFLLIPVFWKLPRIRPPTITVSTLLFYAPSFFFFNFLPFLTAFKERTCKKWKKFLFA